MPRINSCVFQKRCCQNDGRYKLSIVAGEVVILDKGIPSIDPHNRRIGHVVGFTPQQYYLKLDDGVVIRRKRIFITNRVRGYGKSLKKSEFPSRHPAPRGYRPPKAFEDRFEYKHATEYLVNSDSEDSQDTSTSEYRRTWGIPDNDEEYDNFDPKLNATPSPNERRD